MAIVNRISTYSVFNNTLRDVNTVQANLFDLQGQISSGLKTDNFAGLAGQVEQFTFLEAKIKKTTRFEENNAVNISRLQTMNVSLDQIIDIADEMENLMVLRRNPGIEEDIGFQEQMRNKIEALASELNATFEGRFMFGGTKSNVNPVIIDPEVPQPIEFGTLDRGYYQGSDENQTIRASETVAFEAEVRADDVAFQKMFHAAYWALDADTILDDPDLEDETLRNAIDMIQSGLQDVIAIQADVNIDITNLQDINERHEQLRLYWQGVTEEVSKTDILSASTKVAVDQAVLQATFQAFAGVNSLRLVDFL